MKACNMTSGAEERAEVDNEVPLWQGFTFHHFGLFITAVFALLATVIAVFLMLQHARHYSQPWQQKHIIRILFMIPVYAIISFISYLYYQHAIYWQVLQECYEAFAIASFFTLLCHYLEPTLHDQKVYFRNVRPRNWVLPLNWCQKCTGGKEKGWFRIPRSGLTWFNIIYVGVFQYCVIRVIFTFVAMITQLLKRYCEVSLSPIFAHVWVMSFEALAVTIAMYCLIQFYVQLRKDLAEYKPFLKVLCIKLVIFFSFWQTILISFLSSSSVPGGAIIKPSEHLAYADIKVGIPAMLLSIEMAIFAVMHLFAFSWKPYDLRLNPKAGNSYHGGFMGWMALLDAFNLWDIIKATARGFRWLFVGARKREQDISYEQHRNAVKLGDVEPMPQAVRAPLPQESGLLTENQRPGPPKRSDTQDSDSYKRLLNEQQNTPRFTNAPSYDYPSRDPSREMDPYRQDGVDYSYRPYEGQYTDPGPPPSGYHGR